MEALAQNTYTMEKTLRERVIEILKELKMNKAELALRMNFSRSAVSQYLNGKYNSNPEALEEKLTEFVKEYEEHVKSETEEVKAIGRTVSGVKPKIAYFESKLFERITVLHVVIGEYNEEKVENIFTKFLKIMSKGVEVDGNWVEMEIGEVDWVQGEDTILKSKMAVEFDMTLTGGVYVDVPMKEISANYDYTVKKVGD